MLPAVAPGLLPLPRRDNDLRALPTQHIGPEDVLPNRLPVVVGQVQAHGRPRVVVPNLGLVDAVPVAAGVLGLEQVVDGRRDGAVALQLSIAEGLGPPALLDVGLQAELVDDLLRREFAAGGQGGLVLRQDWQGSRRQERCNVEEGVLEAHGE